MARKRSVYVRMLVICNREGTIGVDNSRRGLRNHEIGVDTRLRSPNGLTLDLVAPF